MKAPTQEQLNDPEWWDENAPISDAQTIYLIWNDAERTTLSRITWARRGEGIITGQDQHLDYYLRPTKALACRTCGESPCGHYNECPPGKSKAERLAQHIAERDAFLAEDEVTEWADGLPPVGTECEAYVRLTGHSEGWCEVEVLKVCEEKKSAAVMLPMMSLQWATEFRPIRTKEQREREKVVAKAMEMTCGKDDGRNTLQRSVIRQCMEELYDAGLLRKGE
ncbi:hypothetical protein NLU14_08700 [Marinobacter sp. 71-i]|uniref:Uncharacterized protein n=1 Tax=Marinobacter iranensis TaxID=2962607 RepID=A0ABT5Y9G5_9GAMM|nr:hypothetical protein [Marinobacter iranensis]MDF0750308.1 hypothetical protein [Marinobacter iranensis]